MLNIHTILFPTDFSACAERAFARAVELATRYEATLHLLNVLVEHVDDPTPKTGRSDPKHDKATDAVGLGLGKQVALTGPLEVVKTQVTSPMPADGILTYAEKHDVAGEDTEVAIQESPGSPGAVRAEQAHEHRVLGDAAWQA